MSPVATQNDKEWLTRLIILPIIITYIDGQHFNTFLDITLQRIYNVNDDERNSNPFKTMTKNVITLTGYRVAPLQSKFLRTSLQEEGQKLPIVRTCSGKRAHRLLCISKIGF